METLRNNFETIVYVLLPVLLIFITFMARRLKFSMKEGYDRATILMLITLLLVFALGAVFGNFPSVANKIRPKLAKVIPAEKFVRTPVPEEDFVVVGDQIEIKKPGNETDPSIVWVITVDNADPTEIIKQGKIVTVGHKQKILPGQMIYLMEVKTKLTGSPVHVTAMPVVPAPAGS